ncbi:24098_t:CDS:2, partial [Racocetra persica]
ISCKVTVLPKDIISQYIQQSDESLKNLYLYGWVMKESTEVPRTFQVKFDEVGDGNLVVNIREGNLHYEKQVLSNNKVAETLTTQQNLPEYSENSSEEKDNAGDVSDISEVDLTTTVKWREQSVKIDQHAIHLIYSYALSYHTLIMPNELEISDSSNLLFSVRRFINAFNTNLDETVIPRSTENKIPGCHKILRKPYPVGQEWKTLADGLTNIIIQLEPCEDKEIEKNKRFVSNYVIGDSWFGSSKLCIALMQNGLYGIFHVKKRRRWPINYPQDMVEKLDTSTTAKADEVERVVKNNTGSTTIKFTRPKVFYEYSQAKGPWILIIKRELAHEMLNGNFSIIENSE